jgi:signal transduction histidine kinase
LLPGIAHRILANVLWGEGFRDEILYHPQNNKDSRGKAGHYGLAGMRERAARIGVKLTVSSSPQGTEVSLFVPGEVIFKSQKERVSLDS